MSSVHDEADNGHQQLAEDEKNEEEGKAETAEHENDDIVSFGTLEEPGEREDEDGSLIRNDATLRSSESQIPEPVEEESENSDLPSRRALERPSSADGSLSIPDDTPSIQVLTMP